MMNKALILLCFISASISVFADLVDQNTVASNDQLSELVKTAKGTYEAPKLDAKIRGEQAKIISNEYLAGKYGSASSLSEAENRKTAPKVGMTRSQVLTNTYWGKPTSTNSTEHKYGVNESWYYQGIGSISFKNGIVEYIHRRSN